MNREHNSIIVGHHREWWDTTNTKPTTDKTNASIMKMIEDSKAETSQERGDDWIRTQPLK